MTDDALARRRAAAMELVARCVAGEPQAQRELFRAESRGVHATLYRILGHNRDIEDLIQDTFVQVFRSLSSFRGDAALGTWIGRITTRVAFAHLRKARASREREKRAGEDEPDIDEMTPLEILASRRAIEALYEILDHLDAKHRIAYALHIIDGRPLREVAELTESSVTAAKSRVFRARKEVNKRAQRNPLLVAYLEAQGQS